MKNVQDALVDQIVAEIEEIAQCYWRMKACCKALPPEKRDELNRKFFDVFLTNTKFVPGQGSFLGRVRTMVLSWRSKKPDRKRIPARTLVSLAESRRVEKIVYKIFYRKRPNQQRIVARGKSSGFSVGRSVRPRQASASYIEALKQAGASKSLVRAMTAQPAANKEYHP